MQQNQVSKNGSTAPTTNAGNSSNLWQQVAASQELHNADSKQAKPAQAIKEVTAPELKKSVVNSSASTAESVTAVVAQSSAQVKVTVNPDSEGGVQQVIAHVLDRSKKLNPKGFPNPPKGDSKQVLPTLANFMYMLDAYGVEVTYNVIKKKLYISIPGHVGSNDNYDNVALAHIHSLAVLNGMSTGQIGAFLLAMGDRNLRNPVRDFICSKPWDGIDRFEAFCKTLNERKGYPPSMKKILMRKWLRSAVAAALMNGGFRCRGVLVLQGPQSIGKGSWFASLIPDGVLSDLLILLGHHLDPSSKDSITKAISHWVVELGELDSTFKKDIARLKGFLTSGSDKIRRPYGRLESEYQRSTVFCASVNDSCFLVDETGNSRFWTIAVESVNYQHGIDMQQLFAQIAVEFHEGAPWWLTQDEEMQLAEINKDHRVVSMVRERLMAAIDLAAPDQSGAQAMTAIEVLREAGIDKPTNPQCKEAASILRELYGDPKKVKGRYVWRVVIASGFVFEGDATSTVVGGSDEY